MLEERRILYPEPSVQTAPAHGLGLGRQALGATEGNSWARRGTQWQGTLPLGPRGPPETWKGTSTLRCPRGDDKDLHSRPPRLFSSGLSNTSKLDAGQTRACIGAIEEPGCDSQGLLIHLGQLPVEMRSCDRDLTITVTVGELLQGDGVGGIPGSEHRLGTLLQTPPSPPREEVPARLQPRASC